MVSDKKQLHCFTIVKSSFLCVKMESVLIIYDDHQQILFIYYDLTIAAVTMVFCQILW